MAAVMFYDYPLCRFTSADAVVPVSGALTVHIAHRNNLYTFISQETFQVIDTLVTRTYQPMVILLLGATLPALPSADEGTIYGNEATAPVTPAAFFKKPRREICPL